MNDTFNVYCDEPKQRALTSQLCCGKFQSCHLENDHQKVMVLGAVWCPFDKTRVKQLIEEAVQ